MREDDAGEPEGLAPRVQQLEGGLEALRAENRRLRASLRGLRRTLRAIDRRIEDEVPGPELPGQRVAWAALRLVERVVGWVAGAISPQWLKPLWRVPGWPHADDERRHHPDLEIFDDDPEATPPGGLLPRTGADAEAAESAPLADVSIVAAASGGGASVERWMESLLMQKRAPGEIVVAVFGDEAEAAAATIEKLGEGRTGPRPELRLVRAGRVGHAHARNLAAAEARGSILAFTDQRAFHPPNWLGELISPLTTDPSRGAVIGALGLSNTGDPWVARRRDLLVTPERYLAPDRLLATRAAFAVRRAAFERVGGFPEHLQHGGEEAVLGLDLITTGVPHAYAPRALTLREGPTSWAAYRRVAALESLALGEAHLAMRSHHAMAVGWAGTLLVAAAAVTAALFAAAAPWTGASSATAALAGVAAALMAGLVATAFFLDRDLMTLWRRTPSLQLGRRSGRLAFGPAWRRVQWARVAGFATGLRAARCRAITRLVDPAKPVFVFMPGHEWFWMQQRPNHLALQLHALGIQVVYCPNNYRERHFGNLRAVPPAIVLCKDPESLRPLRHVVLYAGSPYSRRHLSRFPRGRVILDLVDDPAVSGSSERDFRLMTRRADRHVATAGRLVESLERLGAKPLMLPNATVYEAFAPPPTPRPTPADLAAVRERMPGAPVIGYIGALAPWFDYELVEEAAAARRDYLFVLIGPALEPSDEWRLRELTERHANIAWLGGKPFPELAAYLERFSVATIPFRVNEITLATSPVKMYEYAAAEKPIVTTDLPECRRIGPPVMIATDLASFLAAIDRPARHGIDDDERRALRELALANTWAARARALAELAGLAPPAAPGAGKN